MEPEVVINGESYSLLLPPDSSSALVLSQKAAITGTLDIKKFAEHINNIGKFVQLAYNGVVGAGPAYADLQIKIYNIGCNITKIFGKSALTINSFQSTAEEVSVNLQTTYQFLLDGFEDTAIDILQSLEATAKEMIKIANELKNKIDDQEKETSALEKERIEKERSDKVALALHHASGALKCISVTMMQASFLWEGIEMHCTQLAGQGDRGTLIRSYITAIKEKDEQIKTKFWQSKGFVTQAVIYHARWIALRDVCAEHMPNIREAREKLYRFIRENPTCDEARERAAVLAAELKEILEK